ncbi:MAG: YdbH domain-containing protein [Candidatus Competibacteraceae bacterium]|nr:YdbH domain-containing protein [Candidatus Competibacteraceae bacterium]
MSGFQRIRRPGRWLILLAALPLLAILLLAAIAYAYGVRVQGLDWRDGLVVAGWQWRQNDCDAARGEQLRVIGWRPITLTMDRLTLTDCTIDADIHPTPALADTLAARLTAGAALPWSPAFQLTVGELALPDWPPLAVTVEQEAHRWRVRASHQASEATVAYDHGSGRWTARGESPAEAILPDLRGHLRFEGQGRWLAGHFTGSLRALGQQLGYQDQPHRADATFEIGAVDRQWQLQAALAAPLALGGGWRLEAREALRASGGWSGVDAASLNLWAEGPEGNLALVLDTDGAGEARVGMTGQVAGYRLTGDWRGRIQTAGLTGEPAEVNVAGANLELTLRVPVQTVRAPAWAAEAPFSGRYGTVPFNGVITARQARGAWEGAVQGQFRLPFYAQGGQLDAALPWRYQDGQWLLGAGGRVTVAQGLIEKTLIKPISIAASQPLKLGETGLVGPLKIDAEGVTAARWTLPAVTGQATLAGRQGRVRLQIPQWRSDLNLTAALDAAGATGAVKITSPLSAAMSRGLGFTLQRGHFNGEGSWQWRDSWRLQGAMQVNDLGLDWGDMIASGGTGAARFQMRDGALTLTSTGPIALAALDVGTPIRNIRMGLATDLTTWRATDVYAEILGGHLQAPALHWPSKSEQLVEISGIDLAEVVKLHSNPAVQLEGRVGGALPLRLGQDFIVVREGRLANEGSLSLRVLPSAGATAMGEANQAVRLALDTLSSLNIHAFQADLAMAPDGWLDGKVTIEGVNPERDNLPVVFNYTHRENMLDLLRSLRIGDEVSRPVMNRR